MDAGALRDFLARDFPQVAGQVEVEAVTPAGARLRLRVDERHLRPGGTVSGPTIFLLADVAAYAAILSRVGPEALAVTAGAHLDFLRRPAAGQDLLCEAEVLKLGRTLAVVEARVFSEGRPEPVALASLTYARARALG